MVIIVAILLAVVVNTIMATVVWLRYRQSRAGWLFVGVVACRIVLALTNVIRETTPSRETALLAQSVRWSVLWLFALAMLLFFISLYLPGWWRSRRRIALIATPFLLGALLFALDRLPGGGWLVADIQQINGFYLRQVPGRFGLPLMLAYNLIWFVPLLLLGIVFVRQPEERRAIGALAAAMVLSGTIGGLGRLVPVLAPAVLISSDLLFTGALAYLLLRRRIFETTRVAIDQALESTLEGIVVLGLDERVLYANRAVGGLLGLRAGQRLADLAGQGFDVQALHALLGDERLDFVLDRHDRTIAITASPITHDGQLAGHLLLVRDATQSQAYERELQERQEALLAAVAELQAAHAAQQRLAETVRALALPIIPVAPGVIVLPLIGALDEQRVQEFEQRFLRGIEQQRAHTALVDLTGVPPISHEVAQALLRTVQGARLLGAHTTLVGIRPEIAQSIVALGLDLRLLSTAPTLQIALATLAMRDVQAHVGSGLLPAPG